MVPHSLLQTSPLPSAEVMWYSPPQNPSSLSTCFFSRLAHLPFHFSFQGPDCQCENKWKILAAGAEVYGSDSQGYVFLSTAGLSEVAIET